MTYYLSAYFRVTSALIIREIATRFGSKPGGYIWAIVEPAAYIATMTALFGVISRVPALGSSYPLFFATGYIAYHFYKGVEQYASGAVSANKALFSYPNVSPIDAVTARVTVQTATTMLVSAIVLPVILLTMWRFQPINPVLLLESVFLSVAMGTAVALLNIPLLSKYPLYEKLYQIVTRPLFLVSGIFYLPESIPHPFREILLWNPVVHTVQIFRQGFYPEYRAITLDRDYVWLFTASVFFIGLTVFTANKTSLRARS